MYAHLAINRIMSTLRGIGAFIWTLQTTSAAQMVAAGRSLGSGPTLAAVSTCTRLELYGPAESLRASDVAPAMTLWGAEALAHLAVVAAGADSLVLGETDVLSQVRAAFLPTSGDVRAFGDAAIAAGREARRKVALESRNAGRQLDIALEVADAGIPRGVVIVGTGAMAGHLARRARELGSEQVAVTGRNFDRAKRCAAAAGVDAIPIDALPTRLEGGCLVLAFKGVASAETRNHVVEGAERAGLVIDLTMPSFDWGDRRPRGSVDLEYMARVGKDSRPDVKLKHQLTEAAQGAVQRLWEHRYAASGAATARLYRRVEELRQREVARGVRLGNADAESLDLVTKALVKRLFHRYADALRSEKSPTLIAATEELFRFDVD